jgi:hypothetical protein
LEVFRRKKDIVTLSVDVLHGRKETSIDDLAVKILSDAITLNQTIVGNNGARLLKTLLLRTTTHGFRKFERAAISDAMTISESIV